VNHRPIQKSEDGPSPTRSMVGIGRGPSYYPHILPAVKLGHSQGILPFEIPMFFPEEATKAPAAAVHFHHGSDDEIFLRFLAGDPPFHPRSAESTAQIAESECIGLPSWDRLVADHLIIPSARFRSPFVSGHRRGDEMHIPLHAPDRFHRRQSAPSPLDRSCREPWPGNPFSREAGPLRFMIRPGRRPKACGNPSGPELGFFDSGPICLRVFHHRVFPAFHSRSHPASTSLPRQQERSPGSSQRGASRVLPPQRTADISPAHNSYLNAVLVPFHFFVFNKMVKTWSPSASRTTLLFSVN